jgi:hypothetical protein
MKGSMIFIKGAALLLFALAMTNPHARAQNQTPANVAPPVGWTDPATGLTWTTEYNESSVTWNQANDYCSNLRLGGFSDWRLPTIDELQGIYDPSIDIPGQSSDGEVVIRHVKGNLKLSGNQWSSAYKKSWGVEWSWVFSFNDGSRFSAGTDNSHTSALCVRR